MPRPRPVALLALAIAACAPLPLPAQEVVDSSYPAPDGTLVLQQSIEVPAGLEEVWEAFTTTEGVRSWAVPVAEVDFRLGGTWESTYRLDGRIGDPDNIRNRFLAYLPLRMIVLQAVSAPPDFPHPELLDELFSVIEMEEAGAGQTRVTISGVGYRDGEGYAEIREHFRAGNAWSLRQLHQRFAEGPVDWEAVLGGQR